MIQFIDHLFPSLLWALGWRFLLFLFITYVLMRAFRKLGTKAKSVDAPSRWNANSKPTIGGLVFFIAVCFAMFPLITFYEGQKGTIYLMLAATCAFALGLWDDLKRISPRYKLFGQIIAAIFLLLSSHLTAPFGFQIVSFGFSSLLTGALQIFLIVAIMNSINMLDNMDGVATIAAMPAMIFAFYFDCDEVGVALWMFIAMAAFLAFNWTPSKVFMGDSGSMLLGLVLAWMILGSDSCGEIAINPWHGVSRLFLLLGLGALFIVDSFVAVFNRLRHGVSPAKGGRDHTTHNLFYLGLTQWQIALVFIVLGVVQLFLVYRFVENNRSHPDMSMVAICAPIALYFFLLLGFHLWLSARNLRKGKYVYHS